MRLDLLRWPRWAGDRSYYRYIAYGERIVLPVKRHPAVLLPSFLQAVGVIVVASVIGAGLTPGSGSDGVDAVVGLVVLAFVVRWLWTALQWWKDRIYVTDHRILEVSGVITKKVASMPLWKVTDMTYRRTIWGWLLGYGEMILESAGQDQALERLNYLPDPDHFYRTVSAEARHSSPSGGEETPRAEEPSSPRAVAEDDDTGPIPIVP